MSYFDNHLLNGEKIIYRSSLHPISFIVPIFGTLGGLILIGIALAMRDSLGILLIWPGLFGAVAGPGLLVAGILRYKTTELAVTNRRVLIKTGFFWRRSLELNLNKVEGIGVEQSLLGRILGYGPIVITGTGGTPEGFSDVLDPLEFRRQVQEQIGLAHVQGLAPLLLGQQAPAWLMSR